MSTLFGTLFAHKLFIINLLVLNMTRISSPYRQNIYTTRIQKSELISGDDEIKNKIKINLQKLILDRLSLNKKSHEDDLSDDDYQNILQDLHNDPECHAVLENCGIKSVSSYSWFSNRRATGKVEALKIVLGINMPISHEEEFKAESVNSIFKEKQSAQNSRNSKYQIIESKNAVYAAQIKSDKYTKLKKLYTKSKSNNANGSFLEQGTTATVLKKENKVIKTYTVSEDKINLNKRDFKRFEERFRGKNVANQIRAEVLFSLKKESQQHFAFSVRKEKVSTLTGETNIREDMAYRGDRLKKSKAFSNLSPEDQLMCINDLLSALKDLHSLGFAHLDVAEALKNSTIAPNLGNIVYDENKKCLVFIDFVPLKASKNQRNNEYQNLRNILLNPKAAKNAI